MTLAAHAPTTDESESLATDTSGIAIPPKTGNYSNRPILVRSRMTSGTS